MTRPTKAVVLAAGRGKRLGALTAHTAKPMLEVGGQPIIHRILEGLAAAGITQAVIVTGHGGAEIEEVMGDGSRFSLHLEYRSQPKPNGTARALQLARDFVGGDRFLVAWGDILVEPANYLRALAASETADGALAVNTVDDPATGAAVYVDRDGIVSKLVEKPPPATSTTHWNNAGILILPSGIWPYIESLPISTRGEYELPQAVAAFIAHGGQLKAVMVEGPWFDIGTPENLAAARAYFSGL